MNSAEIYALICAGWSRKKVARILNWSYAEIERVVYAEWTKAVAIRVEGGEAPVPLRNWRTRRNAPVSEMI